MPKSTPPIDPDQLKDIVSAETMSASVASYDLGMLMSQTRRLASDYREQTGQALPVTEELARFDAINLIGLKKIVEQEGVDATDETAIERYLIKGRVIFKGGKARQKLGQLGLHFDWNHLLMVIYDPQYQPCQVFKVNRNVIEMELEKLPVSKRGSMTVAKYKAIGELIWAVDD
ncbi:MAG: hypothetical protein COA86_03000 [Kangiella sp.]|nr:MAG: hypothetical protein COA86_03000 [Kangiella sp.]